MATVRICQSYIALQAKNNNGYEWQPLKKDSWYIDDISHKIQLRFPNKPLILAATYIGCTPTSVIARNKNIVFSIVCTWRLQTYPVMTSVLANNPKQEIKMFRTVITIFAATAFILEAKRIWCVVHDITKGNSSVALLSIIPTSLEKSRIKIYAEDLKLTIFIIYIYTQHLNS